MNIQFSQVERKSLLSSYLLAAFGVFTVLMLTLSFSRHADIHWSVPSEFGQAAQTSQDSLPVAIPAPPPPDGQTQAVVTPEPAGNPASILRPRVVPAPAPSVP